MLDQYLEWGGSLGFQCTERMKKGRKGRKYAIASLSVSIPLEKVSVYRVSIPLSFNLGDINSHLLKFEQSLSGEDQQTEPLAKSMFTIMVRGLFTQLQFPYAQFPCKTISGDLLYDPFWEAVSRIERLVLNTVDYYA